DEILLEFERTLVGVNAGADRIIGHGQHTRRDPKTPSQAGGHLGKRLAGGQSSRSFDVEGEIAVAQAEPRGAAESLQGVHECPGLALPPPAELCVRTACKGVEQCVEIRRDPQAKMHEVIGRVDHAGKAIAQDAFRETEAKLGAADAAGERYYLGVAHRKTSSVTQRIGSRAGRSAAARGNRRTDASAMSSSPSPIEVIVAGAHRALQRKEGSLVERWAAREALKMQEPIVDR